MDQTQASYSASKNALVSGIAATAKSRGCLIDRDSLTKLFDTLGMNEPQLKQMLRLSSENGLYDTNQPVEIAQRVLRLITNISVLLLDDTLRVSRWFRSARVGPAGMRPIDLLTEDGGIEILEKYVDGLPR